MKNILAALVLCCAATTAFAGSIAFQLARTGQTTASRSFTVPDTDMDRIVLAYQSDANVSVNGTATRAQVLNYWMMSVLRGVIDKVNSVEKRKLLDAVPDPTPVNPQ